MQSTFLPSAVSGAKVIQVRRRENQKSIGGASHFMQTSKNQSFLARLRFAWAGIAHGIRAEHSVRFHVAALGLVLVALVVFRPEPEWWALIILTSAAVISAELFNTALEHLADHLHPEIHPSIRIVKDCAAGAVLVASLAALTVAAAFVVHIVSR